MAEDTKGGAQVSTDSAGPKDGKPAGQPDKATPEAGKDGKPAAAVADVPAKTGTQAEPEQPAGDTPKAPEKYDLKVPSGDDVYVDDRLLKRVETLARASGWSNADAQAALEEHLGNVKAELQEFLSVTKADPEYGGAQLAESQRLAKLAIDKIRPAGHGRRESFLRFVNRAGAFNHIEVVSFLADLGKLMAEDKPVSGGPASGGRKPTGDVLYDKTAPAT